MNKQPIIKRPTRVRYVGIRLTKAEYDQIRASARKSGLGFSEYLRRAAVSSGVMA